MPNSGQCDLLDESVDHLVGPDTFALCFVGQHQAMPQTVVHDAAYIFRIDVVTLIEPGMRAAALIERQRRTRAAADVDPAGQILGVFLRRPRRINQIGHIALQGSETLTFAISLARCKNRVL